MAIRAIDPAESIKRPWRVWDATRVGGSQAKPVEIWLCDPGKQWEHDEGEWSLKCGHKNKADDSWARAGEVPGGRFLLEAIKFAFEKGYYTREELGTFIEELFNIVPPLDEQASEASEDAIHSS